MCSYPGLENFQHYEAYKAALQEGQFLNLHYLKFLFFGPPRSGKSSTRRRLLHEIINLSSLGMPSVSTELAETNDVIIKKLTSESAAISNSHWWSMKRSKEDRRAGHQDMFSERDLGYIAQLYFRLISTRSIPTTSMPDHDDSDTAPHPVPDSNAELEEDHGNQFSASPEEIEVDNVLEKLTRILKSNSQEELQEFLEALSMVNMMDVGGQPAFLDALPALTIGPALYMLFF